MRVKTLCSALLLGLWAPVGLQAQGAGQITGVVTSNLGQPVSGVQVSVVGTQHRGLSGADGRYTIANVPAGTRALQASSLGFSSGQQIVTVNAGATVVANFELQDQAIALKEVVVVGYGTQRRESVTGAVANVTSEEFVAGPARSAASLIAGKVPGLAVAMPSGDPRSTPQITLRGFTSINGNRNPLVLVDGVPASLETVSAEDVETISVLKDGSAAAIYGTRGANGVILITTKKHMGGAASFRYDGYTSYQTIFKAPEFLGAADYRSLIEAGTIKKCGGSVVSQCFDDLGFDTNWQDQLLREPVSFRHNLTLSGGALNTNYTAAINFENEQGIFRQSDNRELTGRANIRHSMLDGKLEAEANLISRTQSYLSGRNYDGAWRQATIRNPSDRVYDDNGRWQERGTYMYWNPLGLIEEAKGETEERDTRMNGTITVRPIDQLRLSLMASSSRRSDLSGSSTTFRHVNTTQSGLSGTAARSTGSNVDRVVELTGTYANAFKGHNVTLLGGYGYQDFENESFNASNFQFPTDLFGSDQLGSGTALTEGRASMGSSKESNKLIGFFSRLNYDWQNRFMLMGSVRYEGSSRFGADHKWGTFPAVSAGWRLSEEGFMDRFSFLNDLRIRAGYGVTGIAPGASYLSLTSYRYLTSTSILYDGKWVQGLSPSRNPNPDLRWEEKDEINVGVDFAMLNSRLNGAIDVYRRDTRDMLYDYSVPVPPYLFGSIRANVGHMRNSGVEAQLSYDVLNGSNLKWTSSANWSTNQNKLVTLTNDIFRPQGNCFTGGGTGEPIQTYTHRTCVGGEIGNFWGWKSVDIDDKGEWIVVDSAGANISIRAARERDKQLLGNGIPKQFAAWNNTVRYRAFDLDVSMRGAFDFQVLNFGRMYYENPKILQYNMLKSAFDPVFGKRPVNYDLVYVSYYVEDGDYVKLDNATVGYTFSAGSLGKLSGLLSGARIYVSGRNLATFSGYKGMDPEVGFNGLTPGIEHRDTYPTTRSYTAGLTIRF